MILSKTPIMLMNHFKYKKSRFTREYSCPEFYKVSVHQKLMVVYKARKCKANEVEGNKSWCKMIMKLLLIRCCLHPGENGVATFIVWIEWEAKQKSDSIWGLNKIHFQWISTFLWKSDRHKRGYVTAAASLDNFIHDDFWCKGNRESEYDSNNCIVSQGKIEHLKKIIHLESVKLLAVLGACENFLSS